MIPFYTAEDIEAVLPMADLIDTMAEALAAFSSDQVVQPVRAMLPVEEASGFMAVMPAVMPGAMGTKMVTFYPGNAGTGIDTHQAIIALFDPATGSPLALMDGALITEMRTAAVSAAATRLLAAEDARTLAILGSGVQARSHVDAISCVRALKDIRIWSPTPAHAKTCAEDVGGRALPSAKEAVEGADIVVTATSSKTPVLKGGWLKKGAHVNAVGACLPDWRELDDEVMKAKVYVDSREGALKESGDIILSGASITGELGELFSGRLEPCTAETTLFKSLGLAVEDVAAAKLVHDRMNEKA